MLREIPFIKIALREFSIIGSNKSTRNLLIFIPIVVFLLLASIYQKGALRELPVAVNDLDNSKLSRLITRFIDASPQMKITYEFSSEDKTDSFFLQHNETAIFTIPKGMEKDVMRGKATKVQIITNSSNIVFGNILLREAITLTQTLSAGVQIEKLKAVGLTYEQALNLALPIKVNSRPLFNQYYNYLYYLLPGLMTVLLGMLMFFVATRAINFEVSRGSFEDLVAIAKGSAFSIIAGKAIAYMAMGFGISMMIAMIYFLFGIPFKEREFEIIFLFMFFVLVNILLGFMLSSTIDDELVSLDIAFFYNSPAFVFSGFTFPIFGMPFFDTIYAQFIPYTHFLHAFFKLYQVGAPFVYILPEIAILSLFLATALLTTWIALKLRIKQIISENKPAIAIA